MNFTQKVMLIVGDEVENDGCLEITMNGKEFLNSTEANGNCIFTSPYDQKPKVENLGLGNFWFTGFHRTNGAKILGFWIFPYPLTCLGGMEKCQKSRSFSEIWLWKPVKFAIIFWPAQISLNLFFLKIPKNKLEVPIP